MARCFMQLVCEVRHFTHERNTCLRIFRLVVAQKATGQCRPLVQVQTGRLMLPVCHRKRKWDVASCSWYAKLGILHTKKIYLLANLLFVRGAKDDGATSPSFSIVNGSIDASSLWLEAPIATNYMRGIVNGCSFTTANKYLFADLLLVSS